ncbi:MAG: hypothetical protein K8W52_32765 [Deltaproteobacteria bacterium]|nr:hypothetical protein [Deltaproteobacteria bacterium]
MKRISPSHARALAGALVLGLAGTAHAAVLDDVKAARTPGSPGGVQITTPEADAIAAAASSSDADSAVAAMVAVSAARTDAAFADDADYGRLQAALRRRVIGLSPASEQAGGLTFARDVSGNAVATFDRQRVGYSRVDIIYTFDEWQHTQAQTLAPRGADLAAVLPGAPSVGTLVYALHVFGTDGREFWIANGRELGVGGGKLALDYRFGLSLLDAQPVSGTEPAFAALIHAFASPDSPDGAAVTMNEFSLLVEQLTWEGGPGVQLPAQLAPALAALDDLVAGGTVFDGGIEDGIRGFITRQMLVTASYPGGWDRNRDGRLTLTINEADAVSATVIYTTDGWQQPKVATCARGAAAPICDLGAIPPGTLISYVIAVKDAHGHERWIKSSLGNFFEPAPAAAPRRV